MNEPNEGELILVILVVILFLVMLVDPKEIETSQNQIEDVEETNEEVYSGNVGNGSGGFFSPMGIGI